MSQATASSVAELVRARAREAPDGLAVEGGGASRTWAELDACADLAAARLARLGVRKGDRVAVLASNCPQWIESLLGIQRAGAVLVPLNYRLATAELGRLLDDSAASALLVSRELEGVAPFSGPTLRLDDDTAAAAGHGTGHASPRVEVRPDDLAVIAYTSGTTGMPKGAVWTHRTLLASARVNPFPAELARGARVLLCAPLCAGGALIMAANALATGATLVIEPFVPEPVLRTLAERRIALVGLVPTMIAMLVDAAPRGWSAPSLRRVYYGAGNLRPALYARAREVLGCEFQQAYGMTETCILGTRLDPDDHREELLGSAGKPMPGVAIRLVDEGGAPVAEGTPGEICISSPGNMPGYWRRPEETKRAIEGAWYRTRDVGRIDRAGYLYLVDRQDDMVKSGGFNVSPAEVEEVLLGHPAVEEAAVIGIADERWGQRVTAVVRTRSGAALDARALHEHCRTSLAGYKIPRAILITEQPLPRNALGKLLRHELRARYTAAGAA